MNRLISTVRRCKSILVLRFALTLWIALVLGLILRNADAQGTAIGIPQQTNQHAVALPAQQQPNSAPSATPSSAQNESDADVDDDTLYRAPTKESLASGAMARDEGALHFKPRRKEKVNEVDSLKNLQSSGTDAKFQGAFAVSGVSSIENISSKGKQDSEASNGATEQADDSADSRFAKKRLIFVPQKKDEQNKTRSEDSTPSPTPTASVAAKDSGASKK